MNAIGNTPKATRGTHVRLAEPFRLGRREAPSPGIAL